MLRSFSRPALVIPTLAFFTLAFTAYVTLRHPANAESTPSPEQLWPGTGPWAQEQLDAMTLEQKASQLFATYAYGYFKNTDDPSYRRLVDLVERFGIGGVIFFQGEPLEQVALANDLQDRAAVPLLVSQDMEWGAGMRVEHTTTFPRTMALGATGDPRFAYAAGTVTAAEARALGTHQVFAPVADVNNNPGNPIINVRSFGEDPQLVAEMATAFARGLQEHGAIATAKHFPGHGDTEVDSHMDLPVLGHGRERLDRVELVPFRRLIADGVMSIMTGHLAFPEVEPDSTLPATLSPIVVTEMLRNELGFDGLVVTDAMNMAGLTKNYGVGEAAIRAIEAGVDMLLMSEDEYAARDAIVRAVGEGRLTEARLDASVMRILRAKEWLGLPENRSVDPQRVRRVVGSERHAAISTVIARASLTLLRNEGDLLPFHTPPARILNVVVADSDDPDVGRTFTRRLNAASGSAQVVTRRLGASAHADDFAAVAAEAANFDVVVVPTYLLVRAWSGNITLPEDQRALLNDLIAGPTPVALLSFGNPYVPADLTTQPDAYIAAYGNSDASQQAAAEALFGQSGFHGHLPVTIPGRYPLGAGLEVPQSAPRLGYPIEAGLDSGVLWRVDSLMRASITDHAFPGAAVAIGRGGILAKVQGYGYHTYAAERAVTPRSRFDLASLTKVIATTTATMKLYEAGRLDLDAPVASYLPAFGQNGKEKVTIRQLLTHTGGLIPFRPFHTLGLTERDTLINTIMAEELQYEPGTESRYSDLGMITMMLVIEEVAGQPYADFMRAEVFEPLGMYDTGFLPAGTPDASVVPTEYDGSFRKRLIQGEVHDETAWILGGTSGHAGLFSTAEDLGRFGYMLVNDGRINGRQFLKPETIKLFTTAVDPEKKHTRALGWDTKSPEGYSSGGQRFGPNSFGHTGFTGTSFWVDPDQDLFVILLTNRVYPTRDNRKHIPVRASIADIAYESIIGPPDMALPE